MHERADHQHADAGRRACSPTSASRCPSSSRAITGSSAMLTEGVHSVVDFDQPAAADVGPARMRSGRPTSSIPFGYGRELYFWSFVVAVLVFALGAGVSIYEGILHIAHPEPAVSPVYRLCGAADRLPARRLVDARSLSRLQQVQGRAQLVPGDPAARRTRRRSSSCSKMARRWPESSPPRRACALSQLTGDPFYDGAASVVIGVILGGHRLPARL